MTSDTYMRQYYLRHKDKIKQLSNKYYHSGKGKLSWKKFIENNKEKYNEYHRIYQKTIKKKRLVKEKKEIILYFD